MLCGEVGKEGAHWQLISSEQQMAIENAVAELQLLGEGIKGEAHGKWIRRPNKGYMNCAEVLRAEYRAHPAYGDARFEPTGNAKTATLKKLNISERTYFTKLKMAKAWIEDPSL